MEVSIRDCHTIFTIEKSCQRDLVIINWTNKRVVEREGERERPNFAREIREEIKDEDPNADLKGSW